LIVNFTVEAETVSVPVGNSIYRGEIVQIGPSRKIPIPFINISNIRAAMANEADQESNFLPVLYHPMYAGKSIINIIKDICEIFGYPKGSLGGDWVPMDMLIEEGHENVHMILKDHTTKMITFKEVVELENNWNVRASVARILRRSCEL